MDGFCTRQHRSYSTLSRRIPGIFCLSQVTVRRRTLAAEYQLHPDVLLGCLTVRGRQVIINECIARGAILSPFQSAVSPGSRTWIFYSRFGFASFAWASYVCIATTLMRETGLDNIRSASFSLSALHSACTLLSFT